MRIGKLLRDCAVPILLFSTLTCVIIIYWGLTSLPQIPFDIEIWRLEGSIKSRSWYEPSPRQMMVMDLVINVLPNLNRGRAEDLLGSSFYVPDEPTQEYYSRYGPDLICNLGTERTFVWDHRGMAFSPESEELLIRFDKNGQFESWYIIGSDRWPDVVGESGKKTYRRSRTSIQDDLAANRS